MHICNIFFLSLYALETILFHTQAADHGLPTYHETQQQAVSDQQILQTVDTNFGFQTAHQQGHHEVLQQQTNTQTSHHDTKQRQVPATHGMYAHETNSRVTNTVAQSTLPNQFAKGHSSLHGTTATEFSVQDSTSQTDHNDVRISRLRTHFPYDIDNPYRFVNVNVVAPPEDLNRSTSFSSVTDRVNTAPQLQFSHDHDQKMTTHSNYTYTTSYTGKKVRLSIKNVHIHNVPHHWLLNGIQNIIHHLHHFGCDVNDEQPMTLIPNSKNGTLGKMMILFEHSLQASQFIQCVNTIQEKLDTNQKMIFLTAEFAWAKKMIDSCSYNKSLTGVYCNINTQQNRTTVESMFKKEMVTCGVAKSIRKITLEAPCPVNTNRFNYKAASKKLRDQAVACLIKRRDICTAVGTW